MMFLSNHLQERWLLHDRHRGQRPDVEWVGVRGGVGGAFEGGSCCRRFATSCACETIAMAGRSLVAGRSKLDASQISISSSRLAAINVGFEPELIAEPTEVAQSSQPARVPSKMIKEINAIKGAV